MTFAEEEKSQTSNEVIKVNWKAGLGLVTSVQLVPEPFYCPRYKGASPASTRQMLRRIVKILLFGGGLVAFLHREPDLKPKSCICTYSIFSQVIFYEGSSNAEQRSIVPESCIFKCDSPCSTLVVLPLSSSPPGSFLLTALTCAVDAYMLLYRALFVNCWGHFKALFWHSWCLCAEDAYIALLYWNNVSFYCRYCLIVPFCQTVNMCVCQARQQWWSESIQLENVILLTGRLWCPTTTPRLW